MCRGRGLCFQVYDLGFQSKPLQIRNNVTESRKQRSFDCSLASPQPWASPARLWCLQMLGCSGLRLCLQSPCCPQAAGVGTPRRERGQMCWLAGRVPRSVSESGRPSGKSLDPVGQHPLCNKTKVCFQSPPPEFGGVTGELVRGGDVPGERLPHCCSPGAGFFPRSWKGCPSGTGVLGPAFWWVRTVCPQEATLLHQQPAWGLMFCFILLKSFLTQDIFY